MSRDAFIGRLRKGYEIQTNVAVALLSEGFIVQMPVYSEEKSDDYDLLVSPDREKWECIEVKGRNLSYTSPEDFPYDTIFVTTASRWMNTERIDPPYYVFVSKTNDIVCLKPDEDTMTASKRRDTQKNITDTFMESPASELFSWEELLKKLR